jgi:hypothetical protein
MKKSEPTIPFVIVCIGALIAAYAIGLEIRKIRFKGAQIPAKVVTKSKKPAEGPAKDKVAAKPSTTLETPDQSQDTASAEEESTLSDETTQRTGAQFTIISKEERPDSMRESRPQLSEREGRPQLSERKSITQLSELSEEDLSEEDKAKLKEELREFMDRAKDWTVEETRKARAEIYERYGLPTR